jgi:predicted amidophosphoribosyltransferase
MAGLNPSDGRPNYVWMVNPEGRTCGGCGRLNRLDRHFCGDCGAAVTLACGRCGFANDTGDRYCGRCAAPVGKSAAALKQPKPARPTVRLRPDRDQPAVAADTSLTSEG